MDYDKVVSALQSGAGNVKFTKLNGEFRDMTCTLDTSVIYPDGVPTDLKEVKENREVVRCYDTLAEGWRSFRLDTVLEFSSPTFSWTK